MNSKEMRSIAEAYAKVYAPQEVEEGCGEDSQGILQTPEKTDAKVTSDLSKPVKELPGARPNRDKAMPKLTTGIPDGQPKTSWGESTEEEIFDLVLEYLIKQEFAENQEQAIEIMAESLSQSDIETILNEIIDAKGAARMDAAKGKKKETEDETNKRLMLGKHSPAAKYGK